MFVDRDRELNLLNQCYLSEKAELFVLYGRRRVGKTELLRAFCQGKRHIFYVADLGTEAASLAEFTRQISRFSFGNQDSLSPFATWDAAFEFLADQSAAERLAVVIDEFTYLIDANNAIPSVIQRLWDTRLQHTRIMLVLCGSYVGMMEQHVLAYRAPLYGRRTAQWKLQALVFRDAQLLLPGFSTDDMVRAYAVLGGIPAYLRQFDDRRPLLTNIVENVLAQGRFLHDEPRFLMLQELRDPSRYFSVLRAIAGGRTRMNEIAQQAGIAASSVSFYLNTLQEMGLVERVVPATENPSHKSKRGIYRLLDHYFRFWFRFVFPNRSLLECGEIEQVRTQIEAELDQYVGPIFESICREHVWQLHKDGTLRFTPQSVGSWWGSNDEIDVVAIGEDAALLGECKWTTKPVGENLLDDLMRKAQPLIRQHKWRTVNYALFSRSGFTPALAARAEAESVLLITPQMLLGHAQS
ncbi:MAG: ATP-binding protein [Caldilineaceae bacterium]|nr:ATP-binding protein [Caldilineaceae bacterium]MBP8106295.1 ATP-binding protein [Caldilineaceae bacterium]MBP8122587.1 ATP-binding protein [Caldilineaceae bacterium]MBP9071149.1 ATP-binding protein [Caldilineaceae bacterium]